MGDSAALVERMSTAVRTAYQAIAVLKEENRALKDENSVLKAELDVLRRSQSADTVIQNGDKMVIERERPTLNSFSGPSIPAKTFSTLLAPKIEPLKAQTTQPPPPPVLTTRIVAARLNSVDITIGTSNYANVVAERGLHKPNGKASFGNSPDSKIIFKFLFDLSSNNVHTVADNISQVSMETTCKAFVQLINSYFTMEVLVAWGNAVRTEHVHTLPKELLVRLDLLSTLLVSIGSRASNGLIRVHKLVAILKKVLLGAVRCQWVLPHYALAMGTQQAHHACSDIKLTYGHEVDVDIDADGEHAATLARAVAAEQEGEEADESSVDSRGGDLPDDSEDSDACDDFDDDNNGDNDGDVCENEPLADHLQEATPVPQSQRKAAFTSMFGLDSSSDEGESDIDDASQNDRDKGGMEIVNDNDDVYEITNDNDCDEAVISMDDSLAIPALSTPVVPATPVASVAAQLTTKTSPLSTPGHIVLEHASKLYLLLSTLVRLRLVDELIDTLRDLRLVTAQNVSVGTIVATVAVLGSRRFRALHLPGVRAELVALLSFWQADLSTKTALSSGGFSDADRATMKALSQSLVKFRAQIDPHTSLLVVKRLPLLVENAAFSIPEDTRDLQQVFRLAGFWGSLSSLSASEATICFEAIGLDRISVHCQRLKDILSGWFKPAAAEDHDEFHRSLAVADFISSDEYLFCTYQCHVQHTLKQAHIPQGRLIAEELLIDEFALHWKTQLTALSSSADPLRYRLVLDTIRTTRILLQSFLSTEYEKAEGGWRSGVSGDGFRLSSRLDNRLTVGIALVKKLAEFGVPHFGGVSVMTSLQPSLQWLHYSSLTSRNLLEYGQFIDHCAEHVFHSGFPSDSDDAGLYKADLLRHTTEAKLAVVCTEIIALLSLVSIEAFIYILVCSLRGLLHTFRISFGNEKSAVDLNMHSLIIEATRTLNEIPSPWAGVARADIQHEMLTTSRLIARCSQQADHTWIMQLASVQPVFVINLDKRPDRLRRLLITLEQANMSAVRIQAIDGTSSDRAAANPAEMFQRNFSSSSDPPPLTDDNAARPTHTVLRLEDTYANIPESDVQLTWDSTLNNKFDPRCPVNTHTLATPSERACAASHLRVWRTIASVCGSKVAKSKLRGAHGLYHDPSSSFNDRVVSSPESIYKELNSLKIGKSSKNTASSSKLSANATGGSTSAAKDSSGPRSQLSLVEESFHQQEGTDYFIVFEDDVSFPQQSLVDLRATVHSIMKVLPASVDILYLCGVLPTACPSFKLRSMRGDPFYSINYAWTLQAYVLRSRAVEVLLSKLPIFAPVDNFVASLVYGGELRACIVKDKLTQRLAGALMDNGKRRSDSDVRPSGRVFSGLPRRPAGTIAEDKDKAKAGDKKKKVDRRKRIKH